MLRVSRRRIEELKTKVKTFYEIHRPRTKVERTVSKNIDTFLLPLGPYRNLTTATAAIFAFHPECFVLNHAWIRIQNVNRLNFLRYPDAIHVKRFIDASTVLAKNGMRGDYGGNVLLSHAFDDERVLEAYTARYGRNV